MLSNLKNSINSGKQFRLVKYFALASFIVLALFSFPFSVFISQKTKDILIESYKNYARLLGENLNHQVLVYFYIPIMTQYGRVQLRDEKQSELMDQVIKNAIHGFNIDVVNVYSPTQPIIAYSTDPDLIGKKVKETPGYKMAVNGDHSSGMIREGGDIWGIGTDIKSGQKRIRTYIPFRIIIDREEVSIGVFEIILNMTEQYQSIVKFQYYTFGLSILIMTLIFLALLLIVHKAEGIIEQRAKEQRELEDQLHMAERLASIGEMVAGVSHEIKNPLGIIQSTAEFLGALPDADDKQKRLSSVITEESGRLNEILTEFLDFARPQALNIQECYLEEIIRKNLSFLTPELEKNNIRIENNLDGRSFKILADEDLLYRALLNIFINAIQAINGPGNISVRVEHEKDSYKIEISDSGNGISEENLKKIFNPFFTTKQKGSGLGLSIVKKIIEEHQGIIWIDSKKAEGTRVTIRLPRRL